MKVQSLLGGGGEKRRFQKRSGPKGTLVPAAPRFCKGLYPCVAQQDQILCFKSSVMTFKAQEVPSLVFYTNVIPQMNEIIYDVCAPRSMCTGVYERLAVLEIFKLLSESIWDKFQVILFLLHTF